MHQSLQELESICKNTASVGVFAGEGNLPMLKISNPLGTALLSLYGGQVLEFSPNGSLPILWCSQKSLYRPGKAIRGGIPLCTPWFGAAAEKGLPSHGAARIAFWELVCAADFPDGTSQVKLQLKKERAGLESWQCNFDFTLNIQVGKSLKVALTITNTAAETLAVSSALHSYFAVGDIRRTTVEGLENIPFTDALTGQTVTSQDSITFEGEVDRIYAPCASDVLIHDQVNSRTIRVAKAGSLSTVVWNPWIDKAARMADFGDEEYNNMLCVETANAGSDVRLILPGGSHCISTTISTEAL